MFLHRQPSERKVFCLFLFLKEGGMCATALMWRSKDNQFSPSTMWLSGSTARVLPLSYHSGPRVLMVLGFLTLNWCDSAALCGEGSFPFPCTPLKLPPLSSLMWWYQGFRTARCDGGGAGRSSQYWKEILWQKAHHVFEANLGDRMSSCLFFVVCFKIL